MSNLFLFVMLLLVSCGGESGSKKIDNSPRFHDDTGKVLPTDGSITFQEGTEVIRPIVDRFLHISEHCFDRTPFYSALQIKIEKLEGDAIASCRMWYPSLSAEILIDPDSFFHYNEINSERIIVHEMGHCYLNLDHTDGPNYHIMRATINASHQTEYITNYQEAWETMFEDASSCGTFNYSTPF